MCLCVPKVPVRTEVDLLAARYHDIHRCAAIAGNKGCDSSRRARRADNIRAVAACRTPDAQVQATSGDCLAVDSRQVRIGDGKLEWPRGWGQESQDIVAALVHKLAVARPCAVREPLACDDGAEELVLPTNILPKPSAKRFLCGLSFRGGCTHQCRIIAGTSTSSAQHDAAEGQEGTRDRSKSGHGDSWPSDIQ